MAGPLLADAKQQETGAKQNGLAVNVLLKNLFGHLLVAALEHLGALAERGDEVVNTRDLCAGFPCCSRINSQSGAGGQLPTVMARPS